MLMINIDLVPGVFQPLRRTIASMRISNTTDLADVSDYRIEVMESRSALTGLPARSASCEVLRHGRNQSVWALVARAAAAALKADYTEL